MLFLFFFSSRRRHTRFDCDWSSDVCSSDLHGSRREDNTILRLPSVGPCYGGGLIALTGSRVPTPTSAHNASAPGPCIVTHLNPGVVVEAAGCESRLGGGRGVVAHEEALQVRARRVLAEARRGGPWINVEIAAWVTAGNDLGIPESERPVAHAATIATVARAGVVLHEVVFVVEQGPGCVVDARAHLDVGGRVEVDPVLEAVTR